VCPEMKNAEHKNVKVKEVGGNAADFFRYTFEAKSGLGDFLGAEDRASDVNHVALSCF